MKLICSIILTAKSTVVPSENELSFGSTFQSRELVRRLGRGFCHSFCPATRPIRLDKYSTTKPHSLPTLQDVLIAEFISPDKKGRAKNKLLTDTLLRVRSRNRVISSTCLGVLELSRPFTRRQVSRRSSREPSSTQNRVGLTMCSSCLSKQYSYNA